MSEEPLIAVQEGFTIRTTAPEVAREVPTVQQQATADDVFGNEQGQLVVAMMAIQTGVGIAHLIADNARSEKEEKPRVPRALPVERKD
ncbi:MAG: hypothetical protein EBV06_14120 [Planctomycetia bacterium]|nr:hypothetical protein [Planctomycetia bacterium]